jgi:hypothetical protein
MDVATSFATKARWMKKSPSMEQGRAHVPRFHVQELLIGSRQKQVRNESQNKGVEILTAL